MYHPYIRDHALEVLERVRNFEVETPMMSHKMFLEVVKSQAIRKTA
jgi:hypothetical protein